MATINYDDFFDFEGYEKAIDDLTCRNKAFAKSVQEIDQQIASQRPNHVPFIIAVTAAFLLGYIICFLCSK